MKLPANHVAGKGIVKPTGYGGFGERMLRTMGWSKGEGLGKERSGITQAIQVKKKEDNTGVGGRNSWKWDDNWWERAYSESSAALTAGAGESDSSDSSERSDASGGGSDSDSSDSESSATEALRRNRDGTASSASAQELALLASLTSGSSRVAAGRFGGRDGKMARIRAQEAAALAALERTKATARVATTAVSAATAAVSAAARPASTQAHPDTKRQRIVIEVQPAEPSGETVQAFVPTPAQGWWGERMFVTAGALEGIEETRRRAKETGSRPGFTEDDQAGVFNAAHAGKTQGRIGLGQAQRTVKVGGVKWEGSKKVDFGDDDESAPDSQAAPVPAGWETQIKWKRVTTTYLQKRSKQSTSLAKLEKHFVAHVGERLGDGGQEAPAAVDIAAVLLGKLQKSSQFVVEERRVRLA